MFGIKPAWMAGTRCRCDACVQLQQVSTARRVAYGAASLAVVVLSMFGVVMLGIGAAWVILATLRALAGAL